MSQVSRQTAVPFRKRDTDWAGQRARVHGRRGELALGHAEYEHLWDNPRDVSRKQMAGAAGLDHGEEVRPGLTALRDTGRASRRGGHVSRLGAQREGGEEARTKRLHLGRQERGASGRRSPKKVAKCHLGDRVSLERAVVHFPWNVLSHGAGRYSKS